MRRLFLILSILLLVAVLGSWSIAAQELPWQTKIFGNIKEAKTIVFVIDTSGSIEADLLSHEKSVVTELVEMFIENDRNPMVKVITYNSDISVIVELAPLNDDIIPAIDGIQYTGEDKLTWMNGAIDYACNITQPVHPNGALVLLSDGKPTTPECNGSKDIPTAVERTLAAADNFKTNCSTLAVIGADVDEDSEDEDFLSKIASPGAYVTVTTPPPPGVPAIGQWGMIVLGVLLAGSLAWMIRKKGLGNISA